MSAQKQDKHDRLTVTMHRGYRHLIKMVADELDLTESQFAREAFVEHINRISHRLSSDVRHELGLRFAGGDLRQLGEH
jgi:hypothetical protein